MNFNTIPEALQDLKQGKIILVTDDPDRENEGDFICAAEFATTENIISRHITFHCARHTFATTITLSQGVAIETICKLLGHKNIRTTQIYATLTHAKLANDMELLSERLEKQFAP